MKFLSPLSQRNILYWPFPIKMLKIRMTQADECTHKTLSDTTKIYNIMDMFDLMVMKNYQ